MISVTIEYRRTDGRLRVHASTDAGFNPDCAQDLGNRAVLALMTALEATKGEWAEQVEYQASSERDDGEAEAS